MYFTHWPQSMYSYSSMYPTIRFGKCAARNTTARGVLKARMLLNRRPVQDAHSVVWFHEIVYSQNPGCL